MNVRTDIRLDKAQFFAWAEGRKQKYELADGRVVLLPYVTLYHARLCTNLMAALIKRLDAAQFDVTQGDFAVETGEQGIRYADVMVGPFGAIGSVRSTTAALILAEVLSPSTMHVDFHEKLDEYKSLPMLGTYFICAQDEARVWVWTRTDGAWPDAPAILEGLDAILQLPTLNTTIPLAEIYRNIVG